MKKVDKKIKKQIRLFKKKNWAVKWTKGKRNQAFILKF